MDKRPKRRVNRYIRRTRSNQLSDDKAFNTALPPSYVDALRAAGHTNEADHQAYLAARLVENDAPESDGIPLVSMSHPVAESEGTARVVGSMAMDVSNSLAALNATGPRVDLHRDIHPKVKNVWFMRPGARISPFEPHPLDPITLAFVEMDNGWIVVGKSAPASMANFDEDKGRRFAIDDALRQIWPLEAYLLKEKLAAEARAEVAAMIAEAQPKFAEVEKRLMDNLQEDLDAHRS